MQKVLVIGGTGVMGRYLVPELLYLGFAVDVVTLDDMVSTQPNLKYFKGNGKDISYLKELLKRDYDCIVDFMIYYKSEFEDRYRLFLEHTEQYVYLSSYRVYADEEHPIKETSPRLLDVSRDEEYLASDDYSLQKARGEDFLRKSGLTNWTIVRPAITYSNQRIQLMCLEGNTIINRSRMNKPVIIPREALHAQATMTWGGDVAKMISRIVLNKKAYGDVFTVATSEHHSWETVAKYYEELIGLKYIAVDLDDFLSIRSDEEYNPYRWKVIYDRMYDRIVDNSKILNITGMKQSEITVLREGLAREISNLPKNMVFGNMGYSDRMDAFLEKMTV